MSDSKPAVEARSFDHVPERERSGTIAGQTKFWFMINATLITAYTGAVGPLFGMGLPMTVIALISGTLFGTLFQAFHGAQGPHMGLPQMIQSRVQFGSRGAVVPIAAATVVPIGFAIFFLQTGAGAADSLLPGTFKPAEVVLGVLAVALAIVGYRLILRIEGVIAYVMLANLVVLTVAVFVVLPVGELSSNWSVSFTGFLAQFGAAAGYQIAIAPQVSDYTRYLPSRTSGRAVSASVFFGTAASAIWIESLGAVVALGYPDLDIIEGIRAVGDELGFGAGSVTMAIAVVVCLVTASVGLYSGTVCLLSAAEGFRSFRSTAWLRAATIGVSGVVVIVAGLTLPSDVLTTFSVFLALLGYLLIPWTAVNLTDYYLVRRGRYSITDIIRSDGGIYGKWGRKGLISYGLGLAAMVPFVSNSLYTGPIATELGGADIAFVIGLAVSSVSYLLLMRSTDLTAEWQLVAAAPLSTSALSAQSDTEKSDL